MLTRTLRKCQAQHLDVVVDFRAGAVHGALKLPRGEPTLDEAGLCEVADQLALLKTRVRVRT
jgi:hypothetical protein